MLRINIKCYSVVIELISADGKQHSSIDEECCLTCIYFGKLAL